MAGLITRGLGVGSPLVLDGLGLAGTPDPDLVAACISWLQDDADVVTAFGDSASTPKFFGDVGTVQPAFPYLVITEVGETSNYASIDSGVSNYALGSLQFAIYAAGKKQCKDLRLLVIGSINDAPLRFSDGELLEIRVNDAISPVSPNEGPGVPVGFHSFATFLYRVHRTV